MPKGKVETEPAQYTIPGTRDKPSTTTQRLLIRHATLSETLPTTRADHAHAYFQQKLKIVVNTAHSADPRRNQQRRAHHKSG